MQQVLHMSRSPASDQALRRVHESGKWRVLPLQEDVAATETSLFHVWAARFLQSSSMQVINEVLPIDHSH